MPTHESRTKWYDPRTWFDSSSGIIDAFGGDGFDALSSRAKEDQLISRALGTRGASSYARVVRAEHEIRETALQSAREEFAGYERNCETASRIMVENGIRDARELGRALRRRLDIYRAASRANARKVVDRVDEITSDGLTIDDSPPIPAPPSVSDDTTIHRQVSAYLEAARH